MSNAITDNRAKSRFELDVDGRVAYADYRRQGATLVIPYVFAPPELRGTGASGRLLEGVVEVRLKINRFLIYVVQQFLGDPLQAGFGIPHSRRRVAVDGTKVSLAVYQRIP